MSVDLFNLGAGNPDLGALYAHATLQRIFNGIADDRLALWNDVPGMKSIIHNPQIPGAGTIEGVPIVDTDIYLESYLIGFDAGYLVILGGTKLLGWPQHVLSAMAPTNSWQAFFPTYWYDLAATTLGVLATHIPSGNSKPIVFNGHSLGGAVATTCAYFDFDRPQSRIRKSVTFGAPKARGTAGMDARNFQQVRVINEDDVVPYMPSSPMPVKIFINPLKWWATSMAHYGTPYPLTIDGEVAQINTDSPIWNVLGPALTSTLSFFAPHLMPSYALTLRRRLAKLGRVVDSFWDRANDLINKLEGLTWRIDGFPAVSATVPNGLTVPTPVPLEDEIAAADETLAPVQYGLLDPRQPLPVKDGQSLAAYLAEKSGRDIREVTIHLFTNRIVDLSTLTLASFHEATFAGYAPVGGQEWTCFAAASTTPGRRFARYANFYCVSPDAPNDIWGWYAVAHEGASNQRLLIAWHQEGQAVPIWFERKGLVYKIEFVGL